MSSDFERRVLEFEQSRRTASQQAMAIAAQERRDLEERQRVAREENLAKRKEQIENIVGPVGHFVVEVMGVLGKARWGEGNFEPDYMTFDSGDVLARFVAKQKVPQNHGTRYEYFDVNIVANEQEEPFFAIFELDDKRTVRARTPDLMQTSLEDLMFAQYRDGLVSAGSVYIKYRGGGVSNPWNQGG